MKKRGLTFKMVMVFVILAFLTMVSFFIFDLKKFEDKNFKDVKFKGFYINIGDGKSKIVIDKDGLKVNEIKELGHMYKEETFKLEGIENINIISSSAKCNVLKSDEDKIVVSLNKGVLNNSVSGDTMTLSTEKKGHMEVDIYVKDASKLNINMDCANVEVENNTDLKSLKLNGANVEVFSNSVKPIDMYIKGVTAVCDLVVQENNYDVNLSGIMIDFESAGNSYEGMGDINKTFGTGEKDLTIKATTLELNLN
ncbi:MAG: hypothetical protein Q4E02_00640 [Lagierella massiliensis]|nr:hypothetical protein [Lagierella massiliensis]